MHPFPGLGRHLHLSPSAPQKWVVSIVTLGVLAVIFALAVAYYLFDSRLSQQKEQLQLVGAKIAADFDHEMMLRAYSVSAMRKTAEQYLTGHTRLSIDPTRYLHYVAKDKGYMLEMPAGYSTEDIGSITGLGSVPARDSQTAHEIAMTMGLLPLFQTLLARDKDTPWVYYTSQSHFTSVYPHMSPDEFFFSDKSLEYDVYTMALPKNNPQRKVFWTPPYRDEAGKGMMVTVAAPVYEGEHFRGTIAIDITLSKLALLLEDGLLPNSRVYLYTEGGQFLAGSGSDPGLHPADFPPNTVTERGNLYVTDLSLTSVPWHILLVTSRSGVRMTAFMYALPFSLVVVFLFVSVMLLIALINSLHKVQEYSIRDSLTGIYNRRQFDAVADKELGSTHRDNKYFGLIMLDIDHFKLYNDTYGHQAGDAILKKVSAILSSTLKRQVDNIFRIGGEEFAIMTRADRPDQVETLAQLLRSNIENARLDFPASPQQIITISAGVVSLSPEIALKFEVLYATADQALYTAKEEGRNRMSRVRV